MTATIRSTGCSVSEPMLYVAFELSQRDWKMALTSGFGVAPWVRTVPAGALSEVADVIAQARRRFGLPAARVVSCYEAGRDGFWIHRALIQLGVANRVIDSASIEVSRRARRAKTDRLDAVKLVMLLVRVVAGDRLAWREVRVPTVAEEAARHRSRERTALVQEQTRLINQMRSWVVLHGTRLPRGRRGAWWTALRDWSGAPVPSTVQARLARADERWTLLETQLDALETQEQIAAAAAPPASALGRLVQLKGVAATSATVLLDEGLVWRAFRNRRQIGGLLGFNPVPYASGDVVRDQGISHAGNPRLQSISIQLAWNWVRWQPQSALSQWYRLRFGDGKRARRIGIVAVARRLVIALWRYVTTGLVPSGAILKAA